MENGDPVDDRTRAWACVPLEGFIGRLAEERKGYKAVLGTEATEAERATAWGMSEMIKLVINTFYGVEASRYFEVGNTIVANCDHGRLRGSASG